MKARLLKFIDDQWKQAIVAPQIPPHASTAGRNNLAFNPGTPEKALAV